MLGCAQECPQWRDSDEQRLQRCVDASIGQMKRDTPALSGFDNAQPVLVEMARASCIRQLGIDPQTKQDRRARTSAQA